jgi:hypothetical protein
MHMAMAASALLALGGCLALPIPNRSCDGFGVDSRVVDAQTLAPIAGARIAVVGIAGPATDAASSVAVGPDGHFRIEPVYHWHAGYLFGVISYPIWPFTRDRVAPICGISVHAAGYQPRSFLVVEQGLDAFAEQQRLTAERVVNSTLFVPHLALQRENTPARVEK